MKFAFILSEIVVQLETLNSVWRHIKVDYKNGNLKILIDEQLFLMIPRLPFKPSMVSIGAVKYEPTVNLQGGIINIKIFSNKA